MATIAEVELMNRGFDRMADTLLRKRMLEEQAKERETARGDRRAEREQERGFRERGQALEARRVAASEKSAGANDEMRKILLEDRKTQAAIGQVRNQINDVTARHRAGQISTAQANAQITRLKSSIEEGTNLILKESGLADFTLQDVPEKERGEFNTAATANAKRLGELRSAVVDAQAGGDPVKLKAAEQALEDFQSLAKAGDSERVTEYERDPETGDLVRSRTRSEKAGAQPAARPAAGGKQLTMDQAKKFLADAKGDKTKARELARQAGFTF